jgi:hypothetical protein
MESKTIVTVWMVCLGLVFFTQGSEAYKCYLCSDCTKPTNSITCSTTGGFSTCAKGTTTVGGVTKVDRGCYGEAVPSPACATTDGLELCICSGDNCNGGFAISPMHVLSLLVISFLLLLA